MKEAVKIAGALLNTVTPRNNTKPKVFSPADGQQISSTLMSVTKNPDFITTDSAVKKTELNSSKKKWKNISSAFSSVTITLWFIVIFINYSLKLPLN